MHSSATPSHSGGTYQLNDMRTPSDRTAQLNEATWLSHYLRKLLAAIPLPEVQLAAMFCSMCKHASTKANCLPKQHRLMSVARTRSYENMAVEATPLWKADNQEESCV
jgi:hypothetical protein